MVDLNKLSPAALRAAATGGTDGWGRMASSTGNIRYSEKKPKRLGRQRACHCGCGGRATHAGMANGICLTSACELGVARWVRTGQTKPMQAFLIKAPLGEKAKP